MKRLAMIPVAALLVVGLAGAPAHAVVVTSCGGVSFGVGSSCTTHFTSDGFGYIVNLKPAGLYTGILTATVSSPKNPSFSVQGFYILGNLAGGQDSGNTPDLGAGVWTFTVRASTPSVGAWLGTVEAGPF